MGRFPHQILRHLSCLQKVPCFEGWRRGVESKSTVRSLARAPQLSSDASWRCCMHTWKESVNSCCNEGLEEPAVQILLVAGAGARSSTPCSMGMGLPGRDKTEWVGKPWLPWLFCPCTVTLHPFSSLLYQSTCASDLWDQAKEALSWVGRVVRWHRGQSFEAKTGQNGVFSSLHIRTSAFFQLEEEIMCRYTKVQTVPDQCRTGKPTLPSLTSGSSPFHALFHKVWTPNSVSAAEPHSK